MSSQNKTVRTVLAAFFLALALVLPFLTAQIPVVGKALCPMHLPVLLCGFFCGPVYAAAVGFIAPLLRLAMFGMPPLMPTGIGMCFELLTYGVVSALLYSHLPEKKPYIYVSLLGAMLSGRAVWGIVRAVIFGVTGSAFGLAAFLSGAFIDAVPGIILQIVLVPVIVMALKKYTVKPTRKR